MRRGIGEKKLPFRHTELFHQVVQRWAADAKLLRGLGQVAVVYTSDFLVGFPDSRIDFKSVPESRPFP